MNCVEIDGEDKDDSIFVFKEFKSCMDRGEVRFVCVRGVGW